jgi:GNAT superfamily N-acetyltransferase
MSDIAFVYTTPVDPRAKPLIDDLIFEYDSRYGDLFDREGAVVELNRYPPAAFAPPEGNFVLLIRDGQTIGGGAFMRFDDITAEFKRIWTRRDLRRRGLARRIVTELEAQALRQGYRRIYLTTGFRQPEAVGLYLSYGYTAQFDLNGDLAAIRKLPFTRELAGPPSLDEPGSLQGCPHLHGAFA